MSSMARMTKYLKPYELKLHFSNKYVRSMVVHKPTSRTVAAATTQEKDFRNELPATCDVAAAAKIAGVLAERLKLQDIPAVAFELKKGERGLDITRGYWTRARPVDIGARARGLDIIRGYATRARPVDIGARARQLQQRRLWSIALGGTVVAGFIIVVLNTFQDNLMFYITPSQAMEKFFNDPTKNRFRLGGLVLEGSLSLSCMMNLMVATYHKHFKNSTEMEFVVTDLANEILVRYRGALPDLFREGHSVVAEGFVRPISLYPGIPPTSPDLHTSITEKAKDSGCYFAAIEVLAKHDEKYMPKEVAAAVAKNKALQEAQEVPALLATTTTEVPTFSPPSTGGQKKKGVAQAPAVAQTYEVHT